MAEVASGYVSILPSMRGFARQVTSETNRSSLLAGRSAGGSFGRVFVRSTLGPLRALGGIAAGIFAAREVTQFFGSAIDEARESQKVSAVTAQVIKSTGAAAHVSAGQVAELAQSISEKVGQDDEAIQSAENLILTFKAVRNEVGKGNDIFNQATKTAVDMSTTFDRGLKASSIQLGKALQDPIKGLTALNRMGVTFNATQTAQITTMVAAGNVMGAQKLILAGVNQQVRGSAEAAATMGERVSVAWSNIKESVGTALLPALDAAERAIMNKVFPALRTFGGYLQTTVGPALQQFGGFLQQEVIPAVSSFAQRIGPELLAAAQSAFGFFKTDVMPVLKNVGRFIVTTLVPAVGNMLTTAFGAFRSAIQRISGAIQSHRAQLTELLHGVRAVAGFIAVTFVPLLKFQLKSSFFVIGHAISITITAISALVDAFNGIKRGIGAVVNFIRSHWKLSAIFAAPALAAIKVVLDHFSAVPGKIKAAFSGAKTLLVDIGKWIIQGLWNGMKGVATSMLNWVDGLGGNMKTILQHKLGIGSPSKVFHQIGSDTMQGLINGLQDREEDLQKRLDAVTSRLSNLRSSAQSLASSLRDSLSGGGDLGGLTITPRNRSVGYTPFQTSAFLRQYGNHLHRFVRLLITMRHRGLSPVLLDQIAGLGPDQGMPILHDLMAGSGSLRAHIAEVNRSEHRIQALSRKFASSQAQFEYGDQIKTQTGLLADIRNELRMVRMDLKNAQRQQHAHASSVTTKARGRG